MWFIFSLLFHFTVLSAENECNYDVDGSKVIAITEIFANERGSDRWTLLFTRDTLFTLWNVTYNEKLGILEAESFSCNFIDRMIDPSQLKVKSNLHTLVAVDHSYERLFLAISSSSESNELKPVYEVFKAELHEDSYYQYFKWEDDEVFTSYKYLMNVLDPRGTQGFKELRAIANVYNKSTKYLVLYRRQEDDRDEETGVTVLLHGKNNLSRVGRYHRRYSRECLVSAATGVQTLFSNNLYSIEIHENRFVLRRLIDNLKSTADCMIGVVLYGSIPELLGQNPDPCESSKLDEIVPFGNWKAVLFGRWMYKTQAGIRIRNRVWERMTWYYPINANGVKYDFAKKIQWGTFVDAAFYWKKKEETYVFFLDEYFVMKGINDIGGKQIKITEKFNIDFNRNDRLTAAFMDDKTDEVYLISGKKFWVVAMESNSANKMQSKSTQFLFGNERNVDAVDVDDQYFYFFDGNEHFTFERNTLQDKVFRAQASVNMKNRDNIFLCYSGKDALHFKFIKFIIAGLLLLLTGASLLTCFVFYFPASKGSSTVRSPPPNELPLKLSVETAKIEESQTPKKPRKKKKH